MILAGAKSDIAGLSDTAGSVIPVPSDCSDYGGRAAFGSSSGSVLIDGANSKNEFFNG
jgi:hypothetical protein